MTAVASPMQGTVVSIDVEEGNLVREGQQLVVLESMKMEHVVAAAWAGVVTGIAIAVGDTVMAGDVLLLVDAREDNEVDDDTMVAGTAAFDLEHVRDT